MNHQNRWEDPEDDGKTIANMNVEGMPWYNRFDADRPERDPNAEQTPLTEAQQRMYTWAAIKAGLFVVLVFAVVFGLFIAFCDFVWFR